MFGRRNSMVSNDDVVAATSAFVTGVAAFLVVDAAPAKRIDAALLGAALLEATKSQQTSLSPAAYGLLETLIANLSLSAEQLQAME